MRELLPLMSGRNVYVKGQYAPDINEVGNTIKMNQNTCSDLIELTVVVYLLLIRLQSLS